MKPRNYGAIVLVLLLAGLATAQVATGTPAFGSFGGGPFDTVNLGNLNVYFAIPVLHKAGRGMPFTYDLSYNSSVWSAASVNGIMTWVPDSIFGWTAQTTASLGYVTYAQHKGSRCPEGGFNWTYDTYVYHDVFGASHAFDASASIDCLGNGWGDTSVASDGSGYTINIVYPPGASITSVRGEVRNPPLARTGAGSKTDANGNQITVNSSGQFFDTLSSTTPVLTVSSPAPPAASTFTYTAPSGASASYTMNYQAYTIRTNFGVSTVPGEYGLGEQHPASRRQPV